ncbi:MAG: transposase [Phycisphaeraceae bacterium]|nr:transposase [Phycisphaeraceae bacterium]
MIASEHREEEIFRRNGIDINRSTMCGWLMGCVAALEPVYKLMHSRILRSQVWSRRTARRFR